MTVACRGLLMLLSAGAEIYRMLHSSSITIHCAVLGALLQVARFDGPHEACLSAGAESYHMPCSTNRSAPPTLPTAWHVRALCT